MFKKAFKIAMYCFLGLIGLGVIASIAGGGDKDRGGSSSGASDSAGASAPKKSDRTATAGQPFQLGEFTYTITKVRTLDAIGNQFVKETAARGAKFLVVSYTERNDGKETHTGMGSPFEIQDDQGRSFRTSSRGETAVMMSTGKGEFITELHPGIERDAYAVFEVPESALSNYRLVAKERGFLGTGRVVVEMQ